MKCASYPKVLAACLLATLLIVLYTPAPLLSVNSGRAKAVTKPAGRPIGNTPQQFRTVLRAFAPFWQVGEGYSSTLVVRNTTGQSSVSATPLIFTADKGQIRLAALQLAPNEVKKISLEEVVRAAGSQAESGALALEMDTSQPASIIGEVITTDYQNGVIFDLPLVAGYANDDAKALHASWWLPDDKTQGSVVLFNGSEQSIVAHPSITIRRKQYTLADVSLASHETRKLDLRSLIRQGTGRDNGQEGAVTGSITLPYDGPAHALLPALLLSNDQNGFSLTGKFFAKRPEPADQSGTTDWHYPLVLAGKADPSLGFRKGSRFTPYALIGNPTGNAVAPQLEASFTAGGTTQSVSLPVRPLAPMETRLVNLSGASEGLIPEGVSSFSLRLSHAGAAGDLALHIFSLEQKKNFVFTAEGTLQTRSRLDSVYWNVADDLQAVLVVQNTGDGEVQAQATLSYDTDGGQGTYKLPPMELPARATRIVNLKQIIGAGQPDEAGQVIPAGTSLGSVTVRATGGQAGDALAGGSVTFDPDAGQYGVFFLPMCSPSGPQFAEPGFPFGFDIILDGIELPPCDFLLPIIIISVCDVFCNFGGIPPRIESITPDRALIGQPVNVVIKGSFFGNNPSLLVDSGITSNITSSSDTQINARFNIAANDAGGNHGVFVENSQGFSNGANFFVQIPSSLSVVIAGPANPLPNGCPHQTPPPPDIGTNLRIRYQINDQSGTPLTTSMTGVHEDKFSLTILGHTNSGFDSFDTPVIASATDSDGTFVDVPVGVCGDPDQLPAGVRDSFGTFTQVIYVLVGTTPYKVRRNDFTLRFRDDCAEETNGSDIDVNNCPAPQ